MAEPSQYLYSFREFAEVLIKHQDLHEGLWGIFVKFGIQGANVGQTDNDLKPAAIVTIAEIGLQRFEAPSNLTVDAALVNPRKPKKGK